MAHGRLHRWTRSARTAVVGREASDRRVFALADIEPGWSVQDDEGTAVGSVRDVEGDWIAVTRGLFRRTLYVPLSAVGHVADGLVRLNHARQDIDESRWSEPPRHPG